MIDVAIAIDGEARNVSLTTIGDGHYNDDGDWVAGVPEPRTIRAAIFPNSRAEGGNSTSGDALKDGPEGIRTEAGWLIWSRHEIKVNDVIADGSVIYRVLFAWPRPEGGFHRAALGRMTT